MLLALASAFALSQSFRTLGAIMGPPLAGHLQLSAQQLGLWSAAFHFAFGVMQLAMGVSLDLWGVRRTILLAFPFAAAGALLSSQAGSFGVLLLGQALIGAGCAPAFLVCTVFIARHFAPQRFAAISGVAMASTSGARASFPRASMHDFSAFSTCSRRAGVSCAAGFPAASARSGRRGGVWAGASFRASPAQKSQWPHGPAPCTLSPKYLKM